MKKEILTLIMLLILTCLKEITLRSEKNDKECGLKNNRI